MTTCIDVKDRYGDRYRIARDPSYFAEYGENALRNDPWYLQIPCERAHIFPWGGERLAASADSRGSRTNRLMEQPFVEVVQDGDDGVTVVFDAEHFDEVANLLKARRRRQGRPLSAEHKLKLLAAGAKYRFARGHNAVITTVDASEATNPTPNTLRSYERV